MEKVNVQKKSKRGEALFVPRLVNVRMSSSESEGSRFLREAAKEESDASDAESQPALDYGSNSESGEDEEEDDEDEDAMIELANQQMLAEMSFDEDGAAETEPVEDGSPVQPAPKKAKVVTVVNPFEKMMQSREVHKPVDPNDKRPILEKPRGAPPKGKIWDKHEGWVDDSKYVPPPPPPKRRVGRPSAAEAVAAAAAAAACGDERADENEAGTRRRRRMFMPPWKSILPWLVFSVGVGMTLHDMDTEATEAIRYVCPSGGEGCAGCNHCGVLQCTLCMERNSCGTSNSGAANPFVCGCHDFQIHSVRQHAAIYHAHEIGQAGQGGIAGGFTQQITDHSLVHRANIKRIFGNVYWLAKENIALRKLPSLCRLLGFHGLPLGSAYKNHAMARDMALSIAAVLRSDINEAARASPTVGLMIDESTDASCTNSMVLYLTGRGPRTRASSLESRANF